MNSRRVCIIRHGGHPEDVRVRKEALALADRGYQVSVICSVSETNSRKREIVNGINVYRLPVKHIRGGIVRYLYEYGLFFSLAAAKLCSLHFQNRFDVIQVNTLPDYLVFVTLLPKLFGAKVVLDLHEPSPELCALKFGRDRPFLMWVVKMAEQLSIKYADRAITVSDQMKENYVKRGAKASKMSVVLNVPNLEFDYDRHKEELESLPKQGFSLVSHGSIIKRYGQDVAVKAVNLVKEVIPDVRLKILGTGEYESEIKKLVKDLKLEQYVQFLGLIPFMDMVTTVGSADIGLVPVEKNDYSDLVHTNKMFEFVAMKRPVVISRTKAVEDFFGADDSCFEYFEPSNEHDLARAIIELHKKPDRREQMVKNSYRKFESVSWDIVKENYCDIFDELCK